MHGNVEVFVDGKRHVAHNTVTTAGINRITGALIGSNPMSGGHDIHTSNGNDLSGGARLGTTASPFDPTTTTEAPSGDYTGPDTYWQLELQLRSTLNLQSNLHLTAPGGTEPLFTAARSEFTPELAASYASGFTVTIRWRLAITLGRGRVDFPDFPEVGNTRTPAATTLARSRWAAARVVSGNVNGTNMARVRVFAEEYTGTPLNPTVHSYTEVGAPGINVTMTQTDNQLLSSSWDYPEISTTVPNNAANNVSHWACIMLGWRTGGAGTPNYDIALAAHKTERLQQSASTTIAGWGCTLRDAG